MYPLGVVTRLAGDGSAGFTDGIGTAAMFNNPYSVAVSSSGTVYVADYSNTLIRMISPAGTTNALIVLMCQELFV